MACEQIKAALAAFDICVETDEGARVTTHCLYPSFEPVNVFVIGFEEGFKIHDGGGASRSAWIHGRDDSLIVRVMGKHARRYNLVVSDGMFVASIPSSD